MKIAFLTSLDPRDRRAWSGILYYMLKALEQHCAEVVPLGPAGQNWYRAARLSGWIGRTFLKQRFDPSHLIILSKALAPGFNRALLRTKPDIIFAPVASTELAFIKTNLPVVYLSDLTARLFRNYSGKLAKIAPWSFDQTDAIERRALSRADHVVYPSEWAARSAAEDYGVARENISVVPFGANLDQTPSLDEIMQARRDFPGTVCRLLFIGVDWERKGGDVAFAVMRELRSRGVDVSLTVIGCSPPSDLSDLHLQVIPFLDKSLPQQRMRMNELLLRSDFMLFPTRREAFGVVCCEANAFGLPVIACNAGGIPIWNGENGVLLDLGASPTAYADAVQALIKNPARYLSLAISSRKLFEQRLNWEAWGNSLVQVFDSVLQNRRNPHQAATNPT